MEFQIVFRIIIKLVEMDYDTSCQKVVILFCNNNPSAYIYNIRDSGAKSHSMVIQ